jgi:2,3-bisphosphoglycerate-independent phosphoglycerate mutase
MRFFDNAALVAFADRLKRPARSAHVMGLVSDGGVHGHMCIFRRPKALADRSVHTVLHLASPTGATAPKSAQDICG